MIPIYLGRIGAARYGIVSLVWLLFGYFGLFDFGLSRATTNLLARPANQTAVRQAEIFWTATFVNTLIGIIGALAFLVVGELIFVSTFKVPAELGTELHDALIWVAFLLPLSTSGAVFVGVLEAHERFRAVNAVQIAGTVLGQFLPLVAVSHWGPRIDIAITATVIARLLTTLPLFFLAFRQSGHGSIPAVTGSTSRELFKYGSWIAVSNLVGPLLVSVDQFAIGAVLGVSSVPRYAIPFNVATRILLIPAAMSRALFPRLTKHDLQDARERAEAATLELSLVLLVVCSFLIAINRVALTKWLGAGFSQSASTVSQVIVFGVWINGISFVPAAFLQSHDKPSITARLHLYELLPFLAALWIGLHLFGLIGASVAWSLRALADAIFLFRAAEYSLNVVRKLVPSFCILALTFLMSTFIQENEFWSIMFSLAVFICTATYAITVDPTCAKLYANFRARLSRA